MIVENKNTRCSCIIRLSKSPRSVKKVVFEIRPPNKAPKNKNTTIEYSLKLT